jgi:hypothetical protein
MFSYDAGPLRLLPWDGHDGRPCYLVGDCNGYMSRLADDAERTQLDMAAELLDHADDMMDDDTVTRDQLGFLNACLASSLRDVHRIAESRGARLAVRAVRQE